MDYFLSSPFTFKMCEDGAMLTCNLFGVEYM